MALALVGLGSNIEPRRGHLKYAVEELGKAPLALKGLSGLYETEPMDVRDQAAFLNMAALVECGLPPEALLERLKQIELGAGKHVTLRRGPRTLDLDLWDCGGELRGTENLTLPHPRLQDRPFCLVPLAELWPEWRHPRLGLTARELLEKLPKPWPRVESLGKF